jgi:hypothetical protein
MVKFIVESVYLLENKDEEGYYDNDENLDHSNSSDDQIKPKLNHSH